MPTLAKAVSFVEPSRWRRSLSYRSSRSATEDRSRSATEDRLDRLERMLEEQRLLLNEALSLLRQQQQGGEPVESRRTGADARRGSARRGSAYNLDGPQLADLVSDPDLREAVRRSSVASLVVPLDFVNLDDDDQIDVQAAEAEATLDVANISLTSKLPVPQVDPAWLGVWKQESVERDNLEAIMTGEGAPWIVRKVVHNLTRRMLVELDASGTLLLKTPIPIKGGFITLPVGPSREECKEITSSLPAVGSASMFAYWNGERVEQRVRKEMKGAEPLFSHIIYELDKSNPGSPKMTILNIETHGRYGVVMRKEAGTNF